MMWNDVRLAFRRIWRHRGFALTSIVALGFGIGAVTTAFAIVRVLTRGLPGDEANRIVRIAMQDVSGPPQRLSYAEFEASRSATNSLSGIAAFRTGAMNVREPGKSPERVSSSYISANAFRLLGERPVLGRDFLADDDRRGAAPVVILGRRTWHQRYNDDPGVIGRTVVVNDVASTIIGVMRDDLRFPVVSDLWLPLSSMPALNQNRTARVVDAFGRLRQDASINQTQTELERATRQTVPPSSDLKRLTPLVTPYVDGNAIRPFLAGLFGSVTCVLIIGCANVAMLMMAGAMHRQRDAAIRASQGATTWHLIRQVLVEVAILSLIGALLGVGLTVLVVRAIAEDSAGINFPYWLRWTVDWRFVARGLAISLIGTTIFALIPAVHFARTAARASTGGVDRVDRPAARWTSGLIASQLAFTLVLLGGAGLMARSFFMLYRADVVIDASNVVLMPLALPAANYGTPEKRRAFYDRLEERFSVTPELTDAAIASSVPFIPTPSREMSLEGRDDVPGLKRPEVTTVLIGKRYFDVVGVRLLRGQPFTDLDGTPGHDTVIVDQRLAERFFPNDDPIGKRIRLTSIDAQTAAETPWLTILGVSPSIRQQQAGDPRQLNPIAYLPRRAESGAFAWVLVRGDTASVAAALRSSIWALDGNLGVDTLVPLGQFMEQSRWANRAFTFLFVGLAWIAIAVAAVGLYGVTAHAITQRTREIGVRVAIGARGGQIIWLFLRRAIAPLVIGTAIGTGGILVLGKLLRLFLVETSATDPFTLISTVVFLATATLAACGWPSARATRINPALALRHE
jgi:putative ABC transport system permease protein